MIFKKLKQLLNGQQWRPYNRMLMFIMWSIIIHFGMIMVCLVAAAPPAAGEYHIKAVFLYNFANFINWPDSAFTSHQAPFRICIFGQDPFGKVMDVTVENQTTRGRELVVERMNSIPTLRSCHILFISKSEENQLKEVFDFIKSHPVLTVSDMENFVVQGGMIKFFNRNNKVRLAINPKALKKVNLKAAANLLRLSRIIEVP